jgi:hypothetical protein
VSDETIYARGADNILAGLTPTGTAPSSTYALATLALLQPAARVRWGATSISLVFTRGVAAQGDVLVIPAHNLDESGVGGSPASVLTLTNNNGLSETIPVPAALYNGLPGTIAVDLTALEPNDSTRTATTWTLTISGNASNVILGGAVAIYGPKRVLNPDLRWDFSLKERAADVNAQNEYFTRYIATLRTYEQVLTASIRTSDLAGVRRWFHENASGTKPGLLWTQLGGIDPLFGIWSPEFNYQIIEGTSYYDIALTFIELSKGKPV